MAEFPALPFWTDAYLSDTRHLTAAQHGAYILLLITAWRASDCALPNDDIRLAKWAAMDERSWARNKGVILEFWEIGTDGRLRQSKLLDVRKDVEVMTEQRQRAGRSSSLKRKETRQRALLRNLNENPTNENENENQTNNPTGLFGDAPSATEKKNAAPKSKRTQFPDGWQPNTGHIQKCLVLGYNVEKLVEQFKNHHIARATVFASWDAAFHTWIGNAERFSKTSGQRYTGHGREPSGVVAAGLRVAARFEAKEKADL